VAVLTAFCWVAGAVGLSLAVGGRGSAGPLVFLGVVVVAGVLVGRRPWLVVGLLVATRVLVWAPDSAVRLLGSVWTWAAALVGAAVVVGGARRCLPRGATVLWHLAFLLPARERAAWRAEVRAVLHACRSDAEVRRQLLGFLAAVPATVVTSWRVGR
jgi:hypothetical protein